MRKSASHVVLSRMQLTLHATRRTPHGASRSMNSMLAWLVKTRRPPSRYRRDARVNGLKTTAMHDMSTPCRTGDSVNPRSSLPYSKALDTSFSFHCFISGGGVPRAFTRRFSHDSIMQKKVYWNNKKTATLGGKYTRLTEPHTMAPGAGSEGMNTGVTEEQ